MTRVHVLTPGFTTPNGRAFLFPLLVHRRALREAGVTVALFKSDGNPAALCDCDVLIVDSKYYSARWVAETPAVLEALADLAERSAKLFYFDITDSSGWDHARALPLVTAYFKNQLLRDRRLYLKPMVGYRLYADYYHQTEGVEDEDGAVSEPVTDPALLDKLQVGWNSGLADYSLMGPSRAALYGRLPLPWLLSHSSAFAAPDAARALDVACRIGSDYKRQTVAWQRKAMAQKLARWTSTDKLSRGAYLEEMARAKIVVSPFGLGEITLRDFEIFMAGALALKPSMAHMETWPDLFRDDETIVAHSWDLSDLEETIETLLAEPARRLEIASHAQDLYRRHTVGRQAAGLFVGQVLRILAAGSRRPPTSEGSESGEGAA